MISEKKFNHNHSLQENVPTTHPTSQPERLPLNEDASSNILFMTETFPTSQFERSLLKENAL